MDRAYGYAAMLPREIVMAGLHAWPFASKSLRALATRALAALMLNELPEQVRSRAHQAIHDGTGYVELRTRIETGQTELALVPTDGSEPSWPARTGAAP